MVKGREKEVKLKVKSNVRYSDLAKLIPSILGSALLGAPTRGGGYDFFWPGVGVDFVRVRAYDEGGGQLTLKHQDKGTLRDRVELNIDLIDAQQAINYQSYVQGPSKVIVYKKYHIFWLDLVTNVCMYETDIDDTLYIEVEGTCQREIDRIVKRLNRSLDLEIVNKSLYEIALDACKEVKNARNKNGSVEPSSS